MSPCSSGSPEIFTANAFHLPMLFPNAAFSQRRRVGSMRGLVHGTLHAADALAGRIASLGVALRRRSGLVKTQVKTSACFEDGNLAYLERWQIRHRLLDLRSSDCYERVSLALDSS
jgi:hypothetical protein